jgi:hypothetical protein
VSSIASLYVVKNGDLPAIVSAAGSARTRAYEPGDLLDGPIELELDDEEAAPRWKKHCRYCVTPSRGSPTTKCSGCTSADPTGP